MHVTSTRNTQSTALDMVYSTAHDSLTAKQFVTLKAKMTKQDTPPYSESFKTQETFLKVIIILLPAFFLFAKTRRRRR